MRSWIFSKQLGGFVVFFMPFRLLLPTKFYQPDALS